MTFNRLLHKALPYIDFGFSQISTPGTCANLVCRYRDLILSCVKNPIIEEELTKTKSSANEFELKLSKSRARKFASSGQVDNDARYMCFSQAFRAMHFRSPKTMRHGERQYRTILLGERAQDAGGPYRESFDIYASELQSPAWITSKPSKPIIRAIRLRNFSSSSIIRIFFKARIFMQN